jgi:hypothetical protein
MWLAIAFRKKRATAVPDFLDSIVLILQQLEIRRLRLLSKNILATADYSQMLRRHRNRRNNRIDSISEARQ